jgi:hypothetical protein
VYGRRRVLCSEQIQSSDVTMSSYVQHHVKCFPAHFAVLHVWFRRMNAHTRSPLASTQFPIKQLHTVSLFSRGHCQLNACALGFKFFDIQYVCGLKGERAVRKSRSPVLMHFFFAISSCSYALTVRYFALCAHSAVKVRKLHCTESPPLRFII